MPTYPNQFTSTATGQTMHSKLGVCTFIPFGVKHMALWRDYHEGKYGGDYWNTVYPVYQAGDQLPSVNRRVEVTYKDNPIYGTGPDPTDPAFVRHCLGLALKLGMGFYRDLHTYPLRAWDLCLQDPANPVVLSEANDWSVVDEIVSFCVENNVPCRLNPPCPDGRGWGTILGYGKPEPIDVPTLQNNWIVPFAEFFADRYRGYESIVSIEPFNEYYTQSLDVVAASSIQAAVYDAVKAVNSNMQVSLMSSFSDQTCQFLSKLWSDGRIGKFDGHVDIHCYPNYDQLFQWGPTVATMHPAKEVPPILTELDNVGRSDVNIAITECGYLYQDHQCNESNPSIRVPTQADQDKQAYVVDSCYQYCKDHARIDTMCHWGFVSMSYVWSDASIIYRFSASGMPNTPIPGIYNQLSSYGLYVPDPANSSNPFRKPDGSPGGTILTPGGSTGGTFM